VIELETERWFELYSREIAEYVVYDKVEQMAIASASKAEGGGFIPAGVKADSFKGKLASI
jgi:hypothetical protein